MTVNKCLIQLAYAIGVSKPLSIYVDLFDNDEESLKGGRLGVYCDSQQEITWSALSYRLDYR